MNSTGSASATLNAFTSQQEAWAQLLGIAPSASPKPVPPIGVPDRRPRRVTVEAGKADRLLSDSIEYLTETREMPSGRITDLSPELPEVQAIQVLMEARHQVYLDCPVIERRSAKGLLGLFSGVERRRG